MRSYAGPLESGGASRARAASWRVSATTTRSRPRRSSRASATRLSLLADARSPERWRGDTEPLDPVAGRIPGARNAFFEEPLPDGLLDAPELAVYCGSGVTARVPLQQLILAGRGDARLYPGSFSEWCRRDGYPIEKGD